MADYRKGGIFSSAKFSKRVFKNLPETVRRGVQRDLAFVTRRDSNANDDKWNKAAMPVSRPTASNAICQVSEQIGSHESAPMHLMSYQPSHSTRSIGNDVSSIIRGQIAVKAAAIGNERQFSTAREELKNLRRMKQPLQSSETPEMFKSPPRKKPCPAERKNPVFPVHCSSLLIANNVLKGLPHLSLHNNDAMMYETAVNKIIKDAINAKFRPNAKNRSFVKINPISQLLNQTAPLSSFSSRSANNCVPPPIDDEEPSRDVTRHFQSNALIAETTADISMASAFDPFNQSIISDDSNLIRKIKARNNTIQNLPDDANSTKFSVSGMCRVINNSSFGDTLVNQASPKSFTNMTTLSKTRSTVTSSTASSSFFKPPTDNSNLFLTTSDSTDVQEDDEFLQYILNRTPSDTGQFDQGSGDEFNDSIFIFDD